jgi:hypothetical protein
MDASYGFSWVGFLLFLDVCTEQKLGHSLLFHWLYVISINFHGLSVLDLILSIFIIS